MIPGIGTPVNVVTVLAGTTIGVLVGHRLPERTRTVVTDGLGLVTLLIAGISAAHVTDAALSDAVGIGAPMLIVLGSVLVGGHHRVAAAHRGPARGLRRAAPAGRRTPLRRRVPAARHARASSRGSSSARWCSASAR